MDYLLQMIRNYDTIKFLLGTSLDGVILTQTSKLEHTFHKFCLLYNCKKKSSPPQSDGGFAAFAFLAPELRDFTPPASRAAIAKRFAYWSAREIDRASPPEYSAKGWRTEPCVNGWFLSSSVHKIPSVCVCDVCAVRECFRV